MEGYKVVARNSEQELESVLVKAPKKYVVKYKPLKWVAKPKDSMGLFFFAKKEDALEFMGDDKDDQHLEMWRCLAMGAQDLYCVEDKLHPIHLQRLIVRMRRSIHTLRFTKDVYTADKILLYAKEDRC